MALVGRENARLDEKNRLAIPARFRKELGTGDVYVSAQTEDGCLNIYAFSTFEETKEEVKRNARTTPEGRAAWRRVFHFTEPVTPDAQGRIVVPARLLAEVGIVAPAEIICAGMDEWFEIWERKSYEMFMGGNG